jgi:hypothetical protein
MGRDIEIDRDELAPRNAPVTKHRDPQQEHENRTRRSIRSGRAVYTLSPDERETLYDIGRFRVLSNEDIATLRYQGNQGRMRQDLKSLTTQGLVERKSVWTGRDREADTFWSLTKAGKNLLKRQYPVPKGQALYIGFVKPAELRHDAAIYPMFKREAAEIEKVDGRVRRVVLDYELKKRVYPALAKAKALSVSEYTKAQAEIARAHGLKVVNKHIVLPDLRIEYEDRHGIAAQMDLEMASKDYHGSHAAEKAVAGFRIYASADTAARLSRALEEREITAEILSL